jgi:hypothetical protein
VKDVKETMQFCLIMHDISFRNEPSRKDNSVALLGYKGLKIYDVNIHAFILLGKMMPRCIVTDGLAARKQKRLSDR